MKNMFIVAAAGILLAGCGQSDPSTVAPATVSPDQGKPTVMLFNAYTGSTLGKEGVAENPVVAFKAGNKVYVGAVLHGQADSSSIKVEWSGSSGAPSGSDQTSIPVAGASVATIDITKQAPLPVGDYKVLVYLDGAPSWELKFTVSS